MSVSEDEAPLEMEIGGNKSPSPNQRPPSYNPEDYATAITKYARAQNLYLTDSKERKSRGKEKDKPPSKESEMGLKQFASLPQLLRRLREDLKTAYISFVKELVCEPHDGVSLLMDLLKTIQFAQANLSGSSTNREQQIALRRTLVDEFECLSCLRACLRFAEAASKLANYRSGIYSLAAATMSSLTRSRTLALQLLTKACESCPNGHKQVVESFSTLRLRFAEPVRCKFLISMMLSYPHPSFQVWGLRLLNTILTTSSSLRERIYLQEEFREAGFDPASIRKALEHRGAATQEQEESVKQELDKWSEGYIDVSLLEQKLSSLKEANTSLQIELQNLRQANMKLLEENVLVKAVGGEVGERCSALKRRLEKHGIPTAPSPTPSVTDSEVSSFVNTVKSNIRKMPHDLTMTSEGTLEEYGPEGERSMSLEWKRVRSDGMPCNPGVTRAMSTRECTGGFIPIPKRRHFLLPPELTSRRSVFMNNPEQKPKVSSKERAPTPPQQGKPEKPPNPQRPESRNGNSQHNTRSPDRGYPDEHIYQHPVKSSQSIRVDNTEHKRSTPIGKESEIEVSDQKINQTSNKSLSSSTSTLSRASSIISLTMIDERKDQGQERQAQYENLVENDEKKQFKRIGKVEDKEITYERDMIVYEAIALGNDTILLDKNNTNESKLSNKSDSSRSSKASTDISEASKSTNTSGLKSAMAYSRKAMNKEGINVRQSVKRYENFLKNEEKPPNDDEITIVNGQPPKETKNFFNGFINGFKNNKKKDSKAEKKDKKNMSHEKQKQANFNRSSENLSDNNQKKNDSIMISKRPTSADGFISRPKDIPCDINREEIVKEEEIIPNRVPQIPPRSRSRGASSQGSRSRTPDAFLYLESMSEASELEVVERRNDKSVQKVAPTPLRRTPSFGSYGIQREIGLRRCETFVSRPTPEREAHKSRELRRAESVHANRFSEYNSHRSYSPRRRRNSISDFVLSIEESEVQISGKRYTQYTAQDIEHHNRKNNAITAEMKRKRNRSVDDAITFTTEYLNSDDSRRITYNNCTNMNQLSKRPEIIAPKPRRNSFRLNGESITQSNPVTSFEVEKRKTSPNGYPPKPEIPPRTARFSPCDEPLVYNHVQKKPSSGALRKSDYGDHGHNFLLNSSPDPKRLQEILSELATTNHGQENRGWPQQGRKSRLPAIPTPDYSATPAGTLQKEGNYRGRHILDLVSGLY